MVNLYDSYQQSKVMNIIPETSKNLLKLKKENASMMANTDKLIDDIKSKYKIELASQHDALEVADMMSKVERDIAAIYNDPSLDETSKFTAILDYKRNVNNDDRLFKIAASNKRMIEAQKEVHPLLQDYFKKHVYPHLRTGETAWTGSFNDNPDADIRAIQSELRSAIPADDFKTDNGGAMNGVSQDRVEKYIKANVDNILNRHNGFKYLMIDGLEESTGFSFDSSNPNHLKALSLFAEDKLAEMNIVYAHGRKPTSNSTVIYNNMNPNSPSTRTSSFMREATGLFNNIANYLGIGADSSGKISSRELKARVIQKLNPGEGKLGAIVTETKTASSADAAIAVFKDGATYHSANISNTETKGDDPRRATSVGEKDVIMAVKLPQSNLFGTGDNGSHSSAINLGSSLSGTLRMMSDSGKILMRQGNVKQTYVMDSYGNIAATANVFVKSSDADELLKALNVYNVGGKGLGDSVRSLGNNGIYKLPIKDPDSGQSINLIFRKGTETIAGRKQDVIYFDVTKSMMDIDGNNLFHHDFNVTKGTGPTKLGVSGATFGEHPLLD